jgi:hypothetical protein
MIDKCKVKELVRNDFDDSLQVRSERQRRVA